MHLCFRQNALLATISEKDANIALLELSPTASSDEEVKKFKAEKDTLVKELKEQVGVYIIKRNIRKCDSKIVQY